MNFIDALWRGPARALGRLRWQTAWLALLVGMLVLWVFWPALHNGFVILDDLDFVVANPHVRTGLRWDNIRWAFTSTGLANWHPLTWLSYMFDCQFFGLNAAHHHFTNVALHAATAALLFLALKQMTGATGRSLAVALLFGVHPLRVESVAWIAERKDVLSGFFWVLAIWAYWQYARPRVLNESDAAGASLPGETGRRRHAAAGYLLTLFFFACGLMSKPMTVTLPFTLLLLDFWPLNRMVAPAGAAARRRIGVLVLEKIPFFGLAAAISVVTFSAQEGAGAFQSAAGLSAGQRLQNALVSYARYLGKIFWPHPLAVGYPFPAHWPALLVWSCGCLLLCVSIVAVLHRRSHPYLIVGWLWFLGTLVPVIGLVQVGSVAMADRYTYVPAIGIFLMIAWGGAEAMERWRWRNAAGALGVAAIVLLCAVATRRQIGVWHNSESLLEHATAAVPGNYFAHYWLGATLADEGRLDDGIAEIQEALRIRPNADVRNGFGLFLEQHGRLDQAVGAFQDAIRVEPGYAAAHYNLGYAFFLQGRLGQAIAEYRRAIGLDPDYFSAHNDLGTALARRGDLEGAIAEFETALRLKPDSADAHFNLGNALGNEGRVDEAIAQFEESLRLQPDAPDVRNNLGVLLTRRGRLDEAIEQFQEALRLRPGFADAQRNLAALLAFKRSHPNL